MLNPRLDLMNKFLLSTIAFIFFFSSIKASSTIYVNHAATGTNAGTSWTNAYTTLQTAIAAASVGDAIWVAKGTYKPHATDQTASFTPNGISLYGGFAGNETLLSQRNVLGNPTILSGDLSGNDVGFTNNSENSFHVVLVSSSGNATLIDGFTVSGGNSNGGVGDPRLGAGIKITDGASTTLKIENCILEYNIAFNGGGLYVYNTSSGQTHTVTVENTIFRNNSQQIQGSAIYKAFNVNLAVINCTFASNGSSNVLYSYTSGGSFSLINSLFQETGTYIVGASSGTFSFDHCLFGDDPSSNSSITTFTNNLISKDALLGTGQILQSGSPAINAGLNTAVLASTDIAGNTRIINTTVDIGAYEYTGPITEVKNITLINELNVFPNPSQDVWNINMSQGQMIKDITIYDGLGKKMRTENYNGAETAVLNIESLPQGMYAVNIISMEGGNFNVKLIKK